MCYAAHDGLQPAPAHVSVSCGVRVAFSMSAYSPVAILGGGKPPPNVTSRKDERVKAAAGAVHLCAWGPTGCEGGGPMGCEGADGV
jgi:hypothetical protein